MSAGLLVAAGCANKPVTAHTPQTAISASDMSYQDLAPGQRLHIVVPVLTSGKREAPKLAASINGKEMVFTRGDLAGYEVSEYTAEKRHGGRVELRFTSAAITKDGKTLQETQPPALPFALPQKPQHIRLLYLIRNSQADHNMAIVAAKKRPALEAFTKRLKSRPDICGSESEIFCVWVPAGIAVRPEAVAN
jgi:hypothetical protein